MNGLFGAVAGYLAGSVLFARVSARLLGKEDVTRNTCDQNPGTANAFRNGGFLCGLLTLMGDLAKGFLPVWLYLRTGSTDDAGFALVLAAPVVGHILPVFYGFQGGKGIATSFGCLLGMLPDGWPVAVLAGCFLFFSGVVRISPHYHRTLLTYLCAGIILAMFGRHGAVTTGFSIIALAIMGRLLSSREDRQTCKVEFLWTH